MTLHIGFTFENFPKKISAEIPFWNRYIGRNILKGIEILILLSTDLNCLVCPNSRNYNSKGTLATHYRFDHYLDTVDYIRTEITTKSIEQLESMIDNAKDNGVMN